MFAGTDFQRSQTQLDSRFDATNRPRSGLMRDPPGITEPCEISCPVAMAANFRFTGKTWLGGDKHGFTTYNYCISLPVMFVFFPPKGNG